MSGSCHRGRECKNRILLTLMETRLNDNEVKEVARMQQMIDSYEGFICALHMMIISEKEINYPSFTDTNLDNEMNKIWRWVEEHKGKL